jgi:hypothetical protein
MPLAKHHSFNQFYQVHITSQMSIRQIRINSLEKIKETIGSYKGSKINLVLVNNTSVLGDLISVEADGVVLRNQRLKKVRLKWNEITELYFDQII